MGDKVGDKMGDKIKHAISQINTLAETKNIPNITKLEFCIMCSLPKTLIDNVILYLKNNYIRMGFLMNISGQMSV